MGAQRSVDNMLLVGGHVVLDFVNTVDVRNDGFGPDYLLSFRDLLVFARRIGLLEDAECPALEGIAVEDPGKAARVLARAKRFRETLYRICLTESSGGEIADADIQALEVAIRNAMRARVLTRTRAGLEYSWKSPAGPAVILHRLALAARDLLVGSEGRRRIRECPGRNCGWLFLDTSKGGRRRWCSDRTCGPASRILKFRATAVG